MYYQCLIRITFFIVIYLWNSVSSLNSIGGQKSPKSNFHPSSRRLDLKKIIGAMMEVQCTVNTLSVMYRYNARYVRLLGDWFTLMDSVKFALPNVTDYNACGVMLDVHSDHQLITVQLPFCNNCCGMTVSNNDDDTIFLHKILVKVSFNVSGMPLWIEEQQHNYFDVSCTKGQHEKDDYGEVTLIVENAHEAAQSASNFKFDVDDEILFHGELSKSKKNLPAELRTFPVNCYLGSENLQNNEKPRHFLRNGCPVKDDQNLGLSSVSHFSNGYTRIGVKIVDYLTQSLFTLKNANRSFTINCELMTCTHSKMHAIVGLPTCPLTTYCSRLKYGRPAVPNSIRTQIFLHAKSSLLTLLEKDSSSKMKDSIDKNENNNEPNHPQFCECATQEVIRKERTTIFNDHLNNVDEISLFTAYFAALVSFLCGALLTVVVWQLKFKYLAAEKDQFFDVPDPSCSLQTDQTMQMIPKYKNNLEDSIENNLAPV